MLLEHNIAYRVNARSGQYPHWGHLRYLHSYVWQAQGRLSVSNPVAPFSRNVASSCHAR